MNTITVDELGRSIRAGAKPRLLDVRTAAEYSRLHAAGACLVPLDELNPSTVASAHLDASEPLYVLCHAGSRAAVACEKLTAMGIGNAVRVDGGTLAWEGASLPVVRAGARVSIERQVRIAAGSLVLVGLALAWCVHPAFVAVSMFVGAGLVFAGITNYCGMAIVMAKMPWNRSPTTPPSDAKIMPSQPGIPRQIGSS
ncbi:MAG TPA: rhodanese-like domain-containing protein [Tepidisphaeraceae bacterium]|nr:rhodanese-like domain-containing protein [Tepidisphaeraceae bacterium]